ncbi:MAG: dipicolinate synthase subunit DpsA [Oscillospiraceae bacterium]|jgi:dipicolinate synthase subunit A
MRPKFYIVGGDPRMEYISAVLHDSGFSVRSGCLYDHSDESCIVLPPAAEKGLVDAAGAFAKKDEIYFGGILPESFMSTISERGAHAYDYFKREECAILNAVPTAEGALQLALEELPVTINFLPVLILGYGHVGKACASLFSQVGAKVTVAVRKATDFAWLEAFRLGSADIRKLVCHVGGYGLIINTVPHRLLTREVLERVKRDCLIIDLASKPGGLDMEAASELGLRVIWALSLPGKVAPVTAGGIIAKTIRNIVSEIMESPSG